MSGTGDTVFTMPSGVTQLRVTGAYAANSSNFIVWLGPSGIACELVSNSSCSLLVNELLGTAWSKTQFAGTYNVGGAGRSVQIVKSSGVAWSFTEVR